MSIKFGNKLQEEYDDFWNTNILEQELNQETRKYIVAKAENGEILGFAGIIINPDCAEIMNIVVKKSERKQGVGQKLLDELINLAKETGLNSLNLEVNEKNIPAIQLYQKNGFEEIGRRKKYYNQTDDAILFQKKL